MSTIQLGKLITDIQYTENYDYYVSAIIDSQSGYLYPKLIHKVTELDAFYGEFSYDKMYQELIDNGIPVLLLPELTVASQYNRCTLRISRSDNNVYRLCNPKYDKKYVYKDVTLPNETTPPGATYNQVLDFENVNYEDIDTDSYDNIPYIIICEDTDNSRGLRDTNRLIQFTAYDENHPYIGEYANYWTGDPIYIDPNEVELNSVQAIVNRIKYELNLAVGDQGELIHEEIVECIDIFDEIAEVLHDSLYEFRSECEYLADINSQRRDLENQISDLESQIEALDPSNISEYERLNNLKDSKSEVLEELKIEYSNFIDTLFSHLMKSIYTHEFLTDDPNNVANALKAVYYDQVNNFLNVLYSEDSTEEKPTCQSILACIDFFIENKVYADGGDNSGGLDQLHTLRLALRYKNPIVAPYFTNIDGLDTYSKSFYDNDQVATATENRKLIEFYSKIKGDRGSNTKISITPIEDAVMVYRIDVINGGISESFNVSTIPPIDGFAYYDPDEYKYIDSINQDSELIGVRFFNYHNVVKDDNGVVLVDEYLSPDEVTTDISELSDIIDNQEEQSSELSRELAKYESRSLPDTSKLEGSEDGYISLDRYLIEYPSSEDMFNTIDVLDESDWYPDLFLIHDLNFGKDSVKFLNRVNDYCTSHKTQALIRVNEMNLTDLNSFMMVTGLFTSDEALKGIDGSRLLTFFEDISIDGVSYPCFYPYIPNILQSKFLEIPQDRLIYDKIPRKFTQYVVDYDENHNPIYNYPDTARNPLPVIDGEFLKSLGINYFDYNNLYYNYKAIREINPSPDFHIIYCTSKISRTFLDNSDELINCEPRLFESKVSELIRKAKNLLPLVDDVTFTYTSDGNRYDIEVSVTIAKLVNKKFVFNITLNIT